MNFNRLTYTIPKRHTLPKLGSAIGNVKRFKVKLAPTFFDSRNAPIHRWYNIIVGFSYASVVDNLLEFKIQNGMTVLDPFVGCGTCVVSSKLFGLNTIGIDPHPIFAFVSKVKTFWEIDDVNNAIVGLISGLRKNIDRKKYLNVNIEEKPKFLHKLYPNQEVLQQLFFIKDYIDINIGNNNLKDFCLLALLKSLKDTTYSKVDGIYIAPTTLKSQVKSPFEALNFNLNLMKNDLELIKSINTSGNSTIYNADSRNIDFIEPNSIDFIYTSPPYLNNFDYAEMTRLDLYFLGIANSWSDITKDVRSRLLINSTTQVNSKWRNNLKISDTIGEDVRSEILYKSEKLSEIRKNRGGKKDYDIIVIEYFNGMEKVFREIYKVLKEGKYFVLILGDSALYGEHIATDELLKKIALTIGFESARIDIIRKRGFKWDLERRKNMPLRESRLVLKK
jgi:DNA modification methylase